MQVRRVLTLNRRIFAVYFVRVFGRILAGRRPVQPRLLPGARVREPRIPPRPIVHQFACDQIAQARQLMTDNHQSVPHLVPGIHTFNIIDRLSATSAARFARAVRISAFLTVSPSPNALPARRRFDSIPSYDEAHFLNLRRRRRLAGDSRAAAISRRLR